MCWHFKAILVFQVTLVYKYVGIEHYRGRPRLTTIEAILRRHQSLLFSLLHEMLGVLFSVHCLLPSLRLDRMHCFTILTLCCCRSVLLPEPSHPECAYPGRCGCCEAEVSTFGVQRYRILHSASQPFMYLEKIGFSSALYIPVNYFTRDEFNNYRQCVLANQIQFRKDPFPS